MSRPTRPAEVSRKLRTESGFGCAVCGSPILEYHHIITWEEKQHYDDKHMVALCPTHHKEYGKMNKKHAYNAKHNPINIRNKRLGGYLRTNIEHQGLKLGASKFSNCRTALSYFGIPLFGHKIIDNEIQIDCFMPNRDFHPEITIKSNDVTAFINNFWDIEFKENFIKFRKKEGEVFLSMDFRKKDVEINGRFHIGLTEFRFSPKTFKIGNVEANDGLTIIGGGPDLNQTAYAYGGSGRKLVLPKYGLKHPRHTFIDVQNTD